MEGTRLCWGLPRAVSLHAFDFYTGRRSQTLWQWKALEVWVTWQPARGLFVRPISGVSNAQLVTAGQFWSFTGQCM